jgi:Phage tail lysozyme
MPTVIDALVVELSLDASKYTKAQREALESFTKLRNEAVKSHKEIAESGNKAAETINLLTRNVVGLFAALIGAGSLTDFIRNVTASEVALSNLAVTLRSTPQEVSAWGLAAERIGGSSAATASSFARMNDAISDFMTTGKALPDAFYLLQAAGGKQIQLNQDLSKTFVDLAAAANKMAAQGPEGRARAGYLLRSLGIDPETTNLMIQNGAKIGAVVKDLQGLAPTSEQLGRAQALNDAWQTLAQNVTAAGRALVDKWSGPMTEVINQAERWVGAINAIDDGLAKMANWLNATQSQGTTPTWRRKLDDLLGFGGGGTPETGTPNPNAKGQSPSDPVYTKDVNAGSGGSGGFWSNVGEGIKNFLSGGSSGSGGSSDSGSSGGGGVGGALHRLFGGGGGNPGIGGWWTQDRMAHAADRLVKEAGLSPMGAAGLVARWSAVEAGGGPTSVNPSSGAFGIGQWLGPRLPGIAGNTDFDAQLSYAIKELNTGGGDSGPASATLRAAKTAAEAARGASQYERAGGYSAITGVDNYTAGTPVADTYNRIYGSAASGNAFAIGDSLAQGIMTAGGIPGTGQIGRQPRDILGDIQKLDSSKLNGKTIILSTGLSNDPGQTALVKAQIDALISKGVPADRIRVLGVDENKFPGANASIMSSLPTGVQFLPITAGPGGVHPTGAGYKSLYDKAISGDGVSSSSGSSLWDSFKPIRNALSGVSLGNSAQAATTRNMSTSKSIANSWDFGGINVYTQATDADGIARGIDKSLMKQQGFASFANYGAW